MSESHDRGNKKSTHDQYTEAYVGILNAYKDQLSRSVEKKNELKQHFFISIKRLMYIMAVTFGMVVVLSLVVMAMMARFNSSSVEILAGAIVSIISSFVTMVLGIYKLPQIIADYLFNKEEDKQMKEIIVNIQKYELDADRAEKMREQASVDAVMNTIITSPDGDSEMDNSSYVDSSIGSSVSDAPLNDNEQFPQDAS